MYLTENESHKARKVFLRKTNPQNSDGVSGWRILIATKWFQAAVKCSQWQTRDGDALLFSWILSPLLAVVVVIASVGWFYSFEIEKLLHVRPHVSHGTSEERFIT